MPSVVSARKLERIYRRPVAKFNTYCIHAEACDTGRPLVDKRILALSLESAWHKAVAEAFEAIEPGTGERPETIQVWRVPAASESHG